MKCIKNGIKREGESCTLNNNCIYPKCTVQEVSTGYRPVKVESIKNQLQDGHVYIVKDESKSVHQHY